MHLYKLRNPSGCSFRLEPDILLRCDYKSSEIVSLYITFYNWMPNWSRLIFSLEVVKKLQFLTSKIFIITWIFVRMAPIAVMVVKAPPVSQAIFFNATVGNGWGPTAYENILQVDEFLASWFWFPKENKNLPCISRDFSGCIWKHFDYFGRVFCASITEDHY